MKYNVSLDKLAKSVTIGITILFAVLMALQVFMKEHQLFAPVYVWILLPLIYFFIFSIRPVSYEVGIDQLVVRRMLRDVVILKTDIESASVIDPKKISGAIRLFGVGGLFGYFGIFTNRAMGRMTWYATRRDRIVLLVTKAGKKIILTPDDPAALVTALST